VLRVYGALPARDREAIAECLRVMCFGMSRFAGRASERPAASAYLDTDGELRAYCHAVAGCVGIMLTRLFAARVPAKNAEAEASRLAYDVGVPAPPPSRPRGGGAAFRSRAVARPVPTWC